LLNLGALSTNYLLSDKESFKEIYALLRDTADKMTDTLVPYVFSMNAYYTAINDEEIAMNSVLKGITKVRADEIFANDKFGFGTIKSLSNWIRAIEGGTTSTIYQYLRNYFTLSDVEMDQIAGPSSFLKALYSAIQVSYALEYDCKKFCDNTTMFAIQWASQNITNLETTFISPKVIPAASLFDLDDTLFGAQPEFSFGIETLGRKSEPLNLTQSLGLASIASFEDSISIFNPKNLYDFFRSYQAQRYDNIKIKFKLVSEAQADAIHDYLLNYVVPKLGNYEDKKGNKQHKAFARLVTYTVDKTVKELEDFLPSEMWARYIGAALIHDLKKCVDFVKVAVSNETRVNTACTKADYNTPAGSGLWSRAFYNGKDDEIYQHLIDVTGLTEDEVDQIFDTTNQKSYGYFAKTTMNIVSDMYLCINKPCSVKEIAQMQFMNATITNNIIKYPDVVEFLQQSESVMGWGYDREVALEYSYFSANKCASNITMDKHAYAAITEGEDSLSIYSNSINFVIDVDHMDKLQNYTDMYKIDSSNLFCVLRYMTQDSLLGGVLVKRQPEDFIFGYDDDTLEILREGNFTEGSDPSVQTHVAINDVYYNKTLINDTNLEIYTGNRHPEKVKTTRSINGGVYINNVVPFYNGTQIIYGNINPFQQNFRVEGTDGLQFGKSLSKGDKPKWFDIKKIQDVQFKHAGKKSYGEVKTWKYNLDEGALKKDYKDNEVKKFHFDGVYNISSNFKLPLGSSAGYFYGVNEDDYGKVTIDGKQPKELNADIQNYVAIEPVSGFTLESKRNEMISVDVHERYLSLPDLDKFVGFVPLMNVESVSIMDQKLFTSKYGFINKYNDIKFYFRVVFYPVSALFLLASVVFFFLMRHYIKTTAKYQPDYQGIKDGFENEEKRLIKQADSHGNVVEKYQVDDTAKQGSTYVDRSHGSEGDSSP
jgi:hypothetical protein